MIRVLRFAMLAALMGGGMSGFIHSAQAQSKGEAEKIVSGLTDAYRAAYDKKDGAALAALFTEDCRYAVGEGAPVTGRETVKERASDYFSGVESAKIELVTTDSRMLTPDVIVEKGVASVTTNGKGQPVVTRYSATYVKTDGKWLIADLVESVIPEADEAAQALSELDWMIGEWQYGGEDHRVRLKANWALNGRFIYRSFEADRPVRGMLQGAEMIGYDPARDVIRVWTFDSEGGIGEATWRREGDKWLAAVRSILPDGTESSAHQVYTVAGEDSFFFESVNRMVDGEALPNTDRVKVTKVEKGE